MQNYTFVHAYRQLRTIFNEKIGKIENGQWTILLLNIACYIVVVYYYAKDEFRGSCFFTGIEIQMILRLS